MVTQLPSKTPSKPTRFHKPTPQELSTLVDTSKEFFYLFNRLPTREELKTWAEESSINLSRYYIMAIILKALRVIEYTKKKRQK